MPYYHKPFLQLNVNATPNDLHSSNQAVGVKILLLDSRKLERTIMSQKRYLPLQISISISLEGPYPMAVDADILQVTESPTAYPHSDKFLKAPCAVLTESGSPFLAHSYYI